MEHPLARFADAQSVDIFSDSHSCESPKDARKMHGMHASLARQIVHGDPVTKLNVQLILDSPQPERRRSTSFRFTGHQTHKLCHQALHLQIAWIKRRSRLGVKFERQPQEFASLKIVGHAEIARAVLQPALPSAFHLNAEHARTTRPDFIPMRHSRGPEGKCEWPKPNVAVPVLPEIIPAKEQEKKGSSCECAGSLRGCEWLSSVKMA